MTFLRSLAFALLLSPCPSLLAQTDITAQLTFTTIDVPGANVTGVSGINTAGDMVGEFGQDNSGPLRGFLYRGGAFTYYSYPGQTVTVPLGINDSGLIVGYAGQNPVVGFLYDGTTFTTLHAGGASATFSEGINNAGMVVGGAGTIYTTKGFQMRGGHFKTLNVPGQYVYVFASGINNFSQVVGSTDYDGFVCRNGSCRIFDFPGANQTSAHGINDTGVIVGWYTMNGCLACGFALRNGKYISFSYPGAKGTLPNGISPSGQIVGAYTFDFQTYHGFVTSPITTADFQ